MTLTGELNPAVTFYTTLNSPVLTGETNGEFNPFDFNKINTELENAKTSEVKEKTFDSLDARFEETESDVKALVADVDVALAEKADKSALTETNLRIATINKSLSDYQNAIASINVNQSPKQTASGYGTVSLPVNAANGQVSNVQIKGLTATNMIKNGDFSNGTTGWTPVLATHTAQNGKLLTTVTAYQGSSSQDGLALTQDHKYYISALVKSDSDLVGLRLALAVSPWTEYGVAAHDGSGAEKRLSLVCPVNLTTPRGVIRVRDNRTTGWTTITSAYHMCIDLTATFGAGNEPTKEECDQIFANYFDGTKSTVSAGRLVSENEDETERTEMYIPDVGVLRSVGDVRDEIVGGEHIKRIDDDGETVLAEPIVTPVNVTGTLVGHPNGTIYFEPVLPVAGVYTASGIEVTDTDFPIDTLERIAKIDFATGVETEVDVSQAVIAGDGLSFTHENLADGDIVFFTYFHGIEGTQPKIDVEYYDSRYVLKDSVTGKFYKVVESVANATLTRTLVEV